MINYKVLCDLIYWQSNVFLEYEKDTSKQDATKRSRTDLASSIIEQLGMPLNSLLHSESSTANVPSGQISQSTADVADKENSDEADHHNEIRVILFILEI